MTAILVLHGPNLNLLGEREPEIYGSTTLAQLDARLIEAGKALDLDVRTAQSNHEGVLIDQLQDARHWAAGAVLNAGGYTHTSIALRDCIASIPLPVVEVHISNVFAREDFRHVSMISPVCCGTITGLGEQSYFLGLLALADIIQRANQVPGAMVGLSLEMNAVLSAHR